jgi:hypothetical protein
MRRALHRLCVAAMLLGPAHVAEAQRAWSVPVNLSPVGQDATRPRVALDSTGQVVAVWMRERGNERTPQWARTALDIGLWALPQILPDTTSSDLAAAAADVAVNADGHGAAVWVRRTGSGGGADQPMVARYDALTRTWSTPEALAPAANTALHARVGVDAVGNVLVVWVGQGATSTTVRARRYDVAEEEWTAAVALSADGVAIVGEPSLAVTDSGAAVAVWAREDGAVQASRFVMGETPAWSAATVVSSSGQASTVPQVAVSRNGTAATIVWHAVLGVTQAVLAARWNPDEELWGAPSQLSLAATAVFEPTVAVDEAGGSTAAWTWFDGRFRNLQTARFDVVADAWTPASDRSSGSDALSPSLSVDSVGNAALVWATAFGASEVVLGSFFRIDVNGWTGATTIVFPPSGRARLPRVRLADSGDAVAVWQFEGDFTRVQASTYALSLAPRLQPATVTGPFVGLSWIPPTAGDPPSAYTVVASSTSGGEPLATLPMGSALATTVPAPDGVYYVRVLATVNTTTIPSNEIIVVVGVGAVPEPPDDLAAVATGNLVQVTWRAPINVDVAPVQTYVVEAGSEPGLANLAWFATGSATPGYTAGGVANGIYWVRVRAQSAGGLGAASPDARLVVGPEPPGAPVLTGQAGEFGAVELRWTAAPAPGAPVTGYRLRAGYAPGQSDAATLDVPAAPLRFSATGVPAGTYYVRIVPLSSQGPGDASNEVVVVVP